MTKQITVPIPQNLIDEASSGEVKRLTNQVARLQKRIVLLEEREKEAASIIETFKDVRTYLADKFDLYEDYGL